MRSRVKIKAWKGGRSERTYARMTKEAKAKLLARVKAEGYKSIGDWLEAQAMAKPNKACSRLETGAANADSESNPAVSSG